MKNATLRQTFRHARSGLQTCGYAMIAALLLSVVNLFAGTTVTTLGGGPNFYANDGGAYYGSTNSVFGTVYSQFHTPSGIALDSSGGYLFVADRDNNEIRELDLAGGQTYTFTTNSVKRPVGVAVDGAGNVFVLNQGSTNAAGVATNGCVLQFDTYGNLLATNSGSILLTNAAGIALDILDNIYVTVNSNTLIRIASASTNITTIATIASAGASLQGIVVKRGGTTAGLIAVSDSGRNGIYLINPSTGLVTTNAGFNGAGDGTGVNNHGVLNASAKFFQPSGLAEAGDGSLLVADSGNNRVKVVTVSGVTTNLYGVSSNLWWSSFPGWSDGTVVEPDQAGDVQSRLPFGLAFAPDGTVYTTEDYYHIIRHVAGAAFLPPPPPPPAAPTGLIAVTNFGQVSLTWTASLNATNYNIGRSTSSGGPYTTIASTANTTYVDTSVINGTTYYYAITALNTGGQSSPSVEVSATPPFPPVPDPQIGYVDFPATSTPIPYTSVFHTVSTVTFNNDVGFVPIVIVGTVGTQTFYTYTNALAAANSVTNPASLTRSAPAGYQDGLSLSQVQVNYSVVPISPAVTVWAVGEQSSHPNSAIVSAQFQFVVGNPNIIGNNAAQFNVSDITSGAQFLYTTDGSDPRTNSNSKLIGPASGTNGIILSLQFPANTNLMLFQIVGFKANYQTSSIASEVFSTTNFVANTISFGFVSGEASSDFVASPGQTFYAPVTLSTLSGTVIDSLQFNLTVTNAGSNPGPSITPNAFAFTSMLMKPAPDLGANIFRPIPPYAFISTNSPLITNTVFYEGTTNWVSLSVTNSSEYLLGVGWAERAGQTNLYNTLAQDLITYSLPHDDFFPNSSEPNEVVLGGYSFQVPAIAAAGQTYQIQIGRPSATTDGIGEPGSSVFIFAPTNGSPVGGAINSIKNVTIGQRKYIVGDVYPFRWFNAGDFGATNLENADVQQVFQSAVYQLNYPPLGSDFFDSMDSSGAFGVTDPTTGYLVSSGSLTPAQQSVVFGGDTTTMDQMAFGDGNLDVADVYVTYVRSIDPQRTWYRRFWTNGVLEAESSSSGAFTNTFNPSVVAKSSSLVVTKAQPAVNPVSNSITNQPKVNFTAGDFQGSPGQTIQIPITAKIFGSYPLRVLMLNLTIVPLDGSPALTVPVQFTPNSALGQPTITDSQGNGNYAATWLNSAIAGLTGTASVGTLTVTIPASATSLSSYAIHFDHASASPNGIASFPKQTLTGLVTLSSRTNSAYNDGIPDSWRLRYFGTINNILSVSNACPSGDGVNNWKKFVAGVDPTIASDFPSTNPVKPAPSGSTSSIHWPTVSGVQYVIQRSGSLFPGNWSNITTNTGTGTDMEFDESSTGPAKFYRVQILH